MRTTKKTITIRYSIPFVAKMSVYVKPPIAEIPFVSAFALLKPSLNEHQIQSPIQGVFEVSASCLQPI